MKKTANQTAKGLLLGLGSGTSFAISALVTKQLYATGVTAWVYVATASAVSLLLLMPFWRGESWRPVWPAGIAGAFSILFYNVALARMDLSVTVVLAFTFPAFALLLDWIFRGRTPTRAQVLSAAFILAGVVMISGNPAEWAGQIDPLGALAALVSALSHAAYGFFGERLSQRQGVQAVVINSLVSMLMALAVNPISVGVGILASRAVWGWYALNAVIGRILPLWLFTSGSRLAGAGPVSLTATMEMPLSLAIGFLFLGEHLRLLQWGGAALVLGAIWLSAVQTDQARNPA